MARKVFISFLGLGNPKKDIPYDPVMYYFGNRHNGTKNVSTFVQSAELELYPNILYFDKFILLATKTSSQNITKLKDEIASKGIVIEEEKFDTTINDISDELTNPDAAWDWFGRLQSKIESYDEIVWDVTHGFRIIPIVFSAAIGYLKRAKNITIVSVLYGAYVSPNEGKIESYPIVDIRDFYTITDWAEGVGRLVDEADAGFLLKIAENEKSGGFVGLNDKKLLENIAKLTKSVRNVELQNIETNAKVALDAIQQRMKTTQTLEKQILEMIVDKFTPLISEAPANGRYSKDYLSLQIILIDLLAKHGLYMQCFTAMREWLGSLGLAILGEHNHSSRNKDEKARRYADVFVNMLQYDENKWDFIGNYLSMKDKLYPAYNSLKSLNNFTEIIALLKDMKTIRDGFDHGWTGKHIAGVPENIHKVFSEAQTIFLSIISIWDEIVTPSFIQVLGVSSKCILINLSNHPSVHWSSEQLAASQVYGEIVDISFPNIDPAGDGEYIQSLCDEYLLKIDALCRDVACNVSTVIVHIMGEMTFTFAMVKALQEKGITCIASTTERVTKEENGVKTSEFRFVSFRNYQ